MSARSEIFLWFVRRYVARRLRREFAKVRIAGLDRFRRALEWGPLILAPNHVAWWDPLWLVALDRAVGGGGHYLMARENLERLFFFRWGGALPIDRSSHKRARRDLERSARVLSGPRRYLVVFPQGEQRPSHLPLQFRRGIIWLARQARVSVVPAGVRYDYLEGPRPFLHISLGAPTLWSEEDDALSLLEQAVRDELETIDRELEHAIERQRQAKPGTIALLTPDPTSPFVDLLDARHRPAHGAVTAPSIHQERS